MKPLALCLTAALVVASTARAQDRPVLTVTLEQAVDRGLASSFRIADATARRDQAQATIDERRALGAPQIIALAGYTRTNHVTAFAVPAISGGGAGLQVIYPDVPDNYRSRLDLQLPLYTGGRIEALTEAARHDTAAATDDI